MHKAAVQAERKIAQGGLSAAQKRKIKGYRPGWDIGQDAWKAA